MEVDVPETLSTLSSALTTLEQALAPLLAVPLKSILNNEDDQLQLAPIEQARTQILTAYLVHDLIWSECSAHSRGSCRAELGDGHHNFGSQGDRQLATALDRLGQHSADLYLTSDSQSTSRRRVSSPRRTRSWLSSYVARAPHASRPT